MHEIMGKGVREIEKESNITVTITKERKPKMTEEQREWLERGQKAHDSYLAARRTAILLERVANVSATAVVAFASIQLVILAFGAYGWWMWIFLPVGVAYIAIWIALVIARTVAERRGMKARFITHDRRYREACLQEMNEDLYGVSFLDLEGTVPLSEWLKQKRGIKDKAFTGKVRDERITEDDYDDYD